MGNSILEAKEETSHHHHHHHQNLNHSTKKKRLKKVDREFFLIQFNLISFHFLLVHRIKFQTNMKAGNFYILYEINGEKNHMIMTCLFQIQSLKVKKSVKCQTTI